MPNVKKTTELSFNPCLLYSLGYSFGISSPFLSVTYVFKKNKTVITVGT